MNEISEEILRLVEEADPDNPIQYVKNIVRDMACEKIKTHICNCKDCQIGCSAKELPHGNSNASIMIIGSTPEDYLEENEYAMNYGESKRVLDIILDNLEVNRDELFFTNCIACYPHKELGGERVKRVPLTEEVENCSVFVKSLIEAVDPLIIITMGPLALSVFEPDKSLLQNRGEWFKIEDIPSIATYSPSYFATSPVDALTLQEQKNDFVEDIESAVNYIREHYPHINL